MLRLSLEINLIAFDEDVLHSALPQCLHMAGAPAMMADEQQRTCLSLWKPTRSREQPFVKRKLLSSC